MIEPLSLLEWFGNLSVQFEKDIMHESLKLLCNIFWGLGAILLPRIVTGQVKGATLYVALLTLGLSESEFPKQNDINRRQNVGKEEEI